MLLKTKLAKKDLGKKIKYKVSTKKFDNETIVINKGSKPR